MWKAHGDPTDYLGGDAVAHAAEVELADVTSEKVAMKHDNTAKVQSALQTEEKEQELLPISRGDRRAGRKGSGIAGGERL